MAYESGRTVKSRKPRKPTTVVSATRDARRIVNRLYPGQPWNSMILSIESRGTADPRTLDAQVRTVVIYDRRLPSPSTLAVELYGLAGVVGCRHDEHTGYITITRTA